VLNVSVGAFLTSGGTDERNRNESRTPARLRPPRRAALLGLVGRLRRHDRVLAARPSAARFGPSATAAAAAVHDGQIDPSAIEDRAALMVRHLAIESRHNRAAGELARVANGGAGPAADGEKAQRRASVGRTVDAENIDRAP